MDKKVTMDKQTLEFVFTNIFIVSGIMKNENQNMKGHERETLYLAFVILKNNLSLKLIWWKKKAEIVNY